MTSQTVTSLNYPVLTSTEAQLYVADVEVSCGFYTSQLGFSVAFVYGDPPFYGSVDHIEGIFTEFESRGVRFAQALKDEPWGARTFVVIDPDGNLILFAGPAE